MLYFLLYFGHKTVHDIIAVGDRMFLEIQDLDFCPNLIKFYPNFTKFTKLDSNFTQFIQICPYFTKFAQIILNFAQICLKKFAWGCGPATPASQLLRHCMIS